MARKITITAATGKRILTKGKILTENIEVIPALEDGTASANGTYRPSESKAGFKSFTVSVPATEPILQEKTVTANGEYSALEDSADGYSKVTVAIPVYGGEYVSLGIKLISFTIDGTTYYSPEGWTWEEWIADTTYNTGGYYSNSHWIVCGIDGGGGRYSVYLNEALQMDYYEITDNATYIHGTYISGTGGGAN